MCCRTWQAIKAIILFSQPYCSKSGVSSIIHQFPKSWSPLLCSPGHEHILRAILTYFGWKLTSAAGFFYLRHKIIIGFALKCMEAVKLIIYRCSHRSWFSFTSLGHTFFIFWFTDPPTLFSANWNKNKILYFGFFLLPPTCKKKNISTFQLHS